MITEKFQCTTGIPKMLVSYDECNNIQTKLYSKPSDTHCYLVSSSCHSSHIVENIPHNTGLRVFTNNSQIHNYVENKETPFMDASLSQLYPQNGRFHHLLWAHVDGHFSSHVRPVVPCLTSGHGSSMRQYLLVCPLIKHYLLLRLNGFKSLISCIHPTMWKIMERLR